MKKPILFLFIFLMLISSALAFRGVLQPLQMNSLNATVSGIDIQTLLNSICSVDDKILKRVAGVWQCADDATSAASTDYIMGSDLSGSNGDANRQYTSTKTKVNVDGLEWFVNLDYNITGNVITFRNKVWDDQGIQLWG